MVWACIKIIRAYQDDFTTNSARREKKGRQKKHCENNIAEWTGLKFCDAVRDAENKMEGEGCNVRGAPTVIDYGIGAGAGLLVRDHHSSIYLLGGLRSLPE